MKEEVLRRQDIFKMFLEKELYNNSAVEMYQKDIKSIVENVMTLYRADNQALINLLKNEFLVIVNEESAIDGQYLEPSQTRKHERCRITEYINNDIKL